MRRLLVSAFLVIAVTLSGCVVVPAGGRSHAGHGPPPHAPAHGYRQKHQGADLVFDRHLGVYLVVGHPDHFYADGRFLRLHGGVWQVGPSLAGPWQIQPARALPPGLRKSHPGKAKGHEHRGGGPAKRGW